LIFLWVSFGFPLESSSGKPFRKPSGLSFGKLLWKDRRKEEGGKWGGEALWSTIFDSYNCFCFTESQWINKMMNSISKVLCSMLAAASVYTTYIVQDSVKADYAEPWQCLFQDPATPIMEGIINLHHDLVVIQIVIGVMVTWMLVRCVMLYTGNPTPTNTTHGETIEIVWTIIPSVILMFLGIPSFTLLYAMEEVVDPALTLKVIGRQWYWTYEYSDYKSGDSDSIQFDSYMVPTDELEPGGLRLLEVDNSVVLPVKTHVRVLVTSSDVLHCWSLPSAGVKMDCVPGRLNQVSLFLNREGTFYGQCSELCGVNHGFMPIAVKGVSSNDFIDWVKTQLDNA
jgi:cytochrome c oxidase subunit 2